MTNLILKHLDRDTIISIKFNLEMDLRESLNGVHNEKYCCLEVAQLIKDLHSINIRLGYVK